MHQEFARMSINGNDDVGGNMHAWSSVLLPLSCPGRGGAARTSHLDAQPEPDVSIIAVEEHRSA
jgi:hypothetical protein